jgi:hypothetical protein
MGLRFNFSAISLTAATTRVQLFSGQIQADPGPPQTEIRLSLSELPDMQPIHFILQLPIHLLREGYIKGFILNRLSHYRVLNKNRVTEVLTTRSPMLLDSIGDRVVMPGNQNAPHGYSFTNFLTVT